MLRNGRSLEASRKVVVSRCRLRIICSKVNASSIFLQPNPFLAFPLGFPLFSDPLVCPNLAGVAV